MIEEITNAKLRGRGGAGFPTGMKWRFTRKASGEDHYVVCNADEGEPGTFKDRVLLSEFPDLVFDGMTIAGYALGARHGLVYLRGEYAYLWDDLQEVLKSSSRLGLLGANICGREGFDFDIRIQLGAGAYICGEESALLESLEGKRGAPRDRPPFPTERGYLSPTDRHRQCRDLRLRCTHHGERSRLVRGLRHKESTGTKLMSVSGDCARPGVYEVSFGITVNDLLDLVGASDARYVQMSGPSGQAVAPKDFGRRIAYEDLSTGGSTMIFGPQRDVLDVALQFADFFVEEFLRVLYAVPGRDHSAQAGDGENCRRPRDARGYRRDGSSRQHRRADEPMRARPDGAEPDPEHDAQFSRALRGKARVQPVHAACHVARRLARGGRDPGPRAGTAGELEWVRKLFGSR